jgi:hypothetical protein
MSIGLWSKSGGVELHNGSTPLLQNTLNLFTNPAGYTSERQRTFLNLSVVAGGTGSGVDFGWWTECLVAMALWRNTDSVVPANSPTPLTTTDTSPEYLQWEILSPTLQLNDTLTPAQVVTWEYKDSVIETFSRRKSEAVLTTTTWLAWEILDPNGIINTTVAGITYNLGAYYAVANFDKAP